MESEVMGIPHSWDLNTWPAHVWPNDANRAKWVLRQYREELSAAGALARSGKMIVVFGEGYEQWLLSRRDNVYTYRSNNPAMRV